MNEKPPRIIYPTLIYVIGIIYIIIGLFAFLMVIVYSQNIVGITLLIASFGVILISIKNNVDRLKSESI